jgi:pSer/pThr/pTyr-binding forkhead associated (FHA) protein
MPMLIHVLGGAAEESQQPEVFDLSHKEEFIGRLQELVIRVQDDSISRLHARVYQKEGRWWIEDLRSRNGIYINGQQTERGEIVEGDIITVGDIYFVLSYRQPDQIWEIEDWVYERRALADKIRHDILQTIRGETETGIRPPPAELKKMPSPPKPEPPPSGPAFDPTRKVPSSAPDTPAQAVGRTWTPPPTATSAPPQPTYDPRLKVSTESSPAPKVVRHDPLPIIIGVTLTVALVAVLIWKYVLTEDQEQTPPPEAPATKQSGGYEARSQY